MHASASELAGFCDRLAMGLDAGVDLRRVLSGETDRSTGRLHGVCERLKQAAQQGQSFAEAIACEAAFFPPLFVSMTKVGERTGRLPEVLKRMSRHYEHRVAMRRSLLRQLAWPFMQLCLALGVCTLLIAIGGVLRDPRGGSLDLLGLGLSGTSGVVWFWTYIAAVVVAGLFVWRSLRERPAPLRKAMSWATAAPVVGPALKTLALERVAWTLSLLLNTEMNLRGVAKLCLAATENERYERHTNAVVADITAGMPLSTAMGRTGEFPGDFLDALAVAEESGTLVESLTRLADRYQEQAERALSTLSGALGVLIWCGIAGVIILMVFRIFGFYTGVLQDALNGI